MIRDRGTREGERKSEGRGMIMKRRKRGKGRKKVVCILVGREI